ncbi:adenosine deaminase [Consotaella salsifontis]|uniref:Adenine deaminase n=1 Tax=Consotaella salsifontis TaxID=1365950 RepID=A0A1T4S1D9_9HYPH|nr:adenosine deaminase [Consotaella salsifontis]SKA21896.1 adenosine deaminase [Consotaella salsifontis]
MNASRVPGLTSSPILPKAELHCHIEGAARPALVAAQAARYGVDVSGIIAEGRYLWHDFTSFLAAYDLAASVFRTGEDYALLAEDHLTRLAADGTIYSEFFISPDHARAAGLSPRAYVEGLAEGMARAEAATGIVARMIVIGVRHLGAEAVEAVARWAAALDHRLVSGFGLAGEERMHHPADFARAFDIARDAGLSLTVHAGELAGAESVAAALDALHPSRIGHGVRAIESGPLLRRLAEEQIVLEVCPGSNLALGIFDGVDTHPLPRLKAAGIPVTVSADDPPFFATTLAEEYAMAGAMGFSQADLVDLTRTAIDAAFVDEESRGRLRTKLEAAAISLGASDVTP